MMGFLDKIIGIVVVGAFLGIIWSRIYAHEKEHLDPLFNKIKGWFSKEEDDSFDTNEDFEVAFKGQT